MTIGARDDNTKALLLSNQRAAGKQVSMTVPPEPKLSYNGPIYIGDNQWNADGQVLSSAAPAHKAHKAGGKATAIAQNQGALNTEHGENKASEKPGVDNRLSSAFLRKEAPGLAQDVDTVGDIAHKTAHAFRYSYVFLALSPVHRLLPVSLAQKRLCARFTSTYECNCAFTENSEGS